MRHDIFPTPVWHIEGTPQVLVDELYQGAYHFKERYPSEKKTNQGGYQSPAFNWKEFQPQGIEYIERVVGNLIGLESLKVGSWWYNINGKGDWNLPHTHPSNDYALVLYLTDSDKLLTFMNPQPMRFATPHYDSMDAKKGDILIFPSDLLHMVMPNPREEDRISLSMNLQLC